MSLIEGALGPVAVLVGDRIEGGRAAAFAALFEAVGDPVGLLGDRRGDSASPQVSRIFLLEYALSATSRRGVVRRRPGPVRPTRSLPINGSNANECLRTTCGDGLGTT